MPAEYLPRLHSFLDTIIYIKRRKGKYILQFCLRKARHMYENIPTTPYFAHRYPGYQLNRGFRTSKSFYFFLAEDWWTLVYTHPLFTPYPIPLHPSEFNSSVLNVYLVETIPSRPKPLLRFAKFGDNEANLPYYNRPPL